MRRMLFVFPLVTMAMVGFATNVFASPILQLQQGGQTVTVMDGGAGDLNATEGIITYVVRSVRYSFNVTTGVSTQSTDRPTWDCPGLTSSPPQAVR